MIIGVLIIFDKKIILKTSILKYPDNYKYHKTITDQIPADCIIVFDQRDI